MNYELAKKLKDAGFPQTGEYFFGKNVGEEWEPRHQDHWAESSFPGFEEGPICPTLSELIEACGDKFRVLYLKTEEWQNGGTVKIHEWQAGKNIWWDMEEVNGEEPRGIGQTPEEAVANLWLKIN